MASVTEPDFAWMVKGLGSAPSDESDTGYEAADSAYQPAPSFEDDEAIREESFDELQENDRFVFDDISDWLVVSDEDEPCDSVDAPTDLVATPAGAALEIDRPVATPIPAARYPWRRPRSLFGQLLYFGSSAAAALVADVLILRALGVDLFELSSPLGRQSAISLFVEVAIASSATIAVIAWLRSGARSSREV